MRFPCRDLRKPLLVEYFRAFGPCEAQINILAFLFIHLIIQILDPMLDIEQVGEYLGVNWINNFDDFLIFFDKKFLEFSEGKID